MHIAVSNKTGLVCYQSDRNNCFSNELIKGEKIKATFNIFNYLKSIPTVYMEQYLLDQMN